MSTLDIAIDLGTCNMVAGNRKKGILLREPSIVAVDTRTKKVTGIGKAVANVLGREHSHLQLVYPLEYGVISNYAMTQVLTNYIMKQVGKGMLFKPRVIACIPSELTGLEAQTMMDTMMGAGARGVELVQQSVAATLGVGIDISRAKGNLLVDVGAGTTDIAVTSMGGVVSKVTVRTAGNTMDQAIEKHLRNAHNLIIGRYTAETIKKEIGSVWKHHPKKSMEVKGRGTITGLPTKIVLDRAELYPVLDETVRNIIRAIGLALEKTPPELSGDISENGMWLTGGGALLTGLAERLQEEVRVPVHIPDSPLDVSFLGAAQSFAYWGSGFDGFYRSRGTR